MITECFNPNCHRELRYLRGGRVVRVIRKAGSLPEIEHFWLCEDCLRSCEFCFLPDGRVLCTGKQKHTTDGVGVHRADGSRAEISETFVHSWWFLNIKRSGRARRMYVFSKRSSRSHYGDDFDTFREDPNIR